MVPQLLDNNLNNRGIINGEQWLGNNGRIWVQPHPITTRHNHGLHKSSLLSVNSILSLVRSN
jgi:hypothetical protein